MGSGETFLLLAAGLAGAFVVHELLCRSRGERLKVPSEHLAQARMMFWLMVGGLVLAGGGLLVEPSRISGLLVLVVSLLAIGWDLRRRRMHDDGQA